MKDSFPQLLQKLIYEHIFTLVEKIIQISVICKYTRYCLTLVTLNSSSKIPMLLSLLLLLTLRRCINIFTLCKLSGDFDIIGFKIAVSSMACIQYIMELKHTDWDFPLINLTKSNKLCPKMRRSPGLLNICE